MAKIEIKGFNSLTLPKKILRKKYEINPKEITSVILKVNGIITNVRNAGIASVGSSQSINFTFLSMKLPTRISAGS